MIVHIVRTDWRTELHTDIRMMSRYSDTLVLYPKDITRSPIYINDVTTLHCVTTMEDRPV